MESNLERLSALTAALRSGSLTLEAYLSQLELRFRRQEGDIRAFLPEAGRFERLRLEARTLCAQYPNPEKRPPLFGIPVGVKDIFHADGFLTRGGSQLPARELQGEEAASVTRLRKAGALILGKTVSTEFAYFAPGPTRNPINLAHTPGGSSSGSAAAVAAHLCPLTLGTQTIGSVCRPAAFCGVVGFKPSYDRIPRAGVLELAASFDHVGTFTQDVEGAELAAAALCNSWRSQPAGSPSPRGILGIPEGPYLHRAGSEALEHFRGLCRRLEAAGWKIAPINLFNDIDEIEERHGLVLAAEAAAFHKRWYPKHRDLYHSRTVDLLERGLRIHSAQLTRAREECAHLCQQLLQSMEARGIDLWITPAAPGPAPLGLSNTGSPIMNLPFSQAGLPSVSLPTGRAANGLPLGTQLVARFGADEQLLHWARELEREFRLVS
ncbi:MAG: amidase [Deltaproteobacteria bacterium]|nr:amidase [Deltaproteobacteria bacterium]